MTCCSISLRKKGRIVPTLTYLVNIKYIITSWSHYPSTVSLYILKLLQDWFLLFAWLFITLAGTNRKADMDFSSSEISISSDSFFSGAATVWGLCDDDKSGWWDKEDWRFLKRPSCCDVGVTERRRLPWEFVGRRRDVCLSIPSLTMKKL